MLYFVYYKWNHTPRNWTWSWPGSFKVKQMSRMYVSLKISCSMYWQCILYIHCSAKTHSPLTDLTLIQTCDRDEYHGLLLQSGVFNISDSLPDLSRDQVPLCYSKMRKKTRITQDICRQEVTDVFEVKGVPVSIWIDN